MTAPPTNADTCGTVRASVLYRAPVFSVIPPFPATDTDRETAQ